VAPDRCCHTAISRWLVEEFPLGDEEFCTHAASIRAENSFCIEVPLAALARYVHNLLCHAGGASG